MFADDPTLKRLSVTDPQKRPLLAQAGYPTRCDVPLYYSAGRYLRPEFGPRLGPEVKGGFRCSSSRRNGACSGTGRHSQRLQVFAPSIPTL